MFADGLEPSSSVVCTVSRRRSGRDRRSSVGSAFCGRPIIATFVGCAMSLAPRRCYWPTATDPFSRVGRSLVRINVPFARSRSSIVRSLGIVSSGLGQSSSAAHRRIAPALRSRPSIVRWLGIFRAAFSCLRRSCTVTRSAPFLLADGGRSILSRRSVDGANQCDVRSIAVATVDRPFARYFS